MRIGIDGNEANVTTRVGVNQYAYQLLKHINFLDQENEYIIYLSSLPLADMPRPSINWDYKVLPGSGKWIIKSLTPYLLSNKDKIDVFFSPSHYTPPIARIPLICSIMDIGYLENSAQFPKLIFWQLKYWSAWSIFISKSIITISKASKKDILRQYRFARNKVHVTHLAYDKYLFNTKSKITNVRRIVNSKNYFLYLGTLKPSKNIERIVSSFASLPQNIKSRHKLVIAGKKGWMYATIFNMVENLGITDNVIFTDYVPEDAKPGLIHNAKLLISPSLTEGFGIHVLEALACGTPVVISRSGSLPEVGGKAAIYVNPFNEASISEGIMKVATANTSTYNELSKASIRQANKFDWKETARKTIDIITKSV